MRSVHFILKPIEDGTDPPQSLAEPLKLHPNLGMIPGRLSIHTYEDTIDASRWNGVYGGDSLAIRTVTQVRSFCEQYAERYAYELVLIDSPSLGILNKVIISTVDGFLIPCMPDMFSLYGIQNIGRALKRWKSDFNTISNLLSDAKLSYFPEKFVSFLGFTIFNAGDIPAEASGIYR